MLTNPCLPPDAKSATGSSPPLLVVAAALLDGRGNVLLQRRRTDRHHGGLWEFPGGKVESGEAPESALVRELREELSIEADPATFAPASFAVGEAGPGRALVLLLYSCTKWSGNPDCQPEDIAAGAACQWWGADRLGHEVGAGDNMPPLDIRLGRVIIPLLKGLAKPADAT
ncbi:(deoxy)nucleoside triphosphate pyrophosphohydrolase [Novosphingobium huizhouense]|uniref:(deoxy)nucleoside triphosphate pyrophosphohydrolase n=1 Tax=Novosphingobium huizhouense TaxID=2866625 RepID=UPI00296E58BE|nr:(deoxy)nucleoside triphosphate pyrophosphohydrolase [Novosphingobium huizhouense]